MNENHLDKKLHYRPRWLMPSISSAVKNHPVVVLTGARQVGKSTLLKHEKLFVSWKYLTFDDFNLIKQAETDSGSLWAETEHIILDEVQKVPKLLSLIKHAVDKEPLKKRFVLSGSANLLLMHKVGESLAGRAVYFPLLPMTEGEMSGKSAPDILSRLFEGKFPKQQVLNNGLKDLYAVLGRGFMPVFLKLNKKEEQLRWWEGYIATYLERDLRQLSQIESLPDFRRLMEAVALRSGQVFNQTEVSRDIGITQPTVYRYLNLLETTCLLKRVPAYSKNRTKRLLKSPKVYFIDPGLTSFLCGYFTEDALKSAKETGSIFEAMILLHLTVLAELLVPKAKIFYWRTTSGQEVDFVLEYGKKLIAFEIKLSANLEYKTLQGLRTFLSEYPETTAGVVVYSGNEVKFLGEKIIAVPWTMLTG